ncbi:MAG: hypothetical protein R3C03_16300 [Pirellulaceae bacterium]
MGLQNSLHNAAVVLQSIPKAKAAKVMAKMEPQDLKVFLRPSTRLTTLPRVKFLMQPIHWPKMSSTSIDTQIKTRNHEWNVEGETKTSLS